MAEANDRGCLFLTEYPDAPAARAIRDIGDAVERFLEGGLS
jgi:hypothetical protein